MSDKDRNYAAEQENSAANPDVGDAPVSELSDVADGDLDGKTTDEGNSLPSNRSRREPQE
jgi:hypothetical protein